MIGADFSTKSKQVLETARILAREWSAKLVLVHVTNLPMFGEGQGLSAVRYEKQEYERLRKKIQRFYKISPHNGIEMVVSFGIPSNDIIAIAKKYRRPIIMVGHSEKGILGRVAVGSVSRSLASRSPVPVWIQ